MKNGVAGLVNGFLRLHSQCSSMVPHLGCSGRLEASGKGILSLLSYLQWLLTLLTKAKQCGCIDGFVVGSDLEAITHLQFADDMILFSSARWDEVVVLKRILRCFELILGLKINLAKSMVVGVGCPLEDVQQLACRLHCKVGKMPLSYLGLPTGT